MKNDPLLINKVAAAVLVAGLLAMVSNDLSGALFHTESEQAIEEQAFVIAEPADEGTATAMADTSQEPAGPADIVPMLASADIASGEKVAKKCGSCHSFDQGGPHKVGPNLYDIVNASIGSKDFNYSDAMSSHGGAWDYVALNEFLYDPKGWMDGTKMSFKGISKDQDRADLIAYLRSLSANPAPLP